MKLLRVEILVAAEQEDLFVGYLAQRISWGWEVEAAEASRTRFVIYFEKDADAQDLVKAVRGQWPEADCSVSTFEDRDWSESWKEFFVPVRIRDTFMVLPPWLNSETDAGGLIPLYIEPKMAFGTGHHATTALCLQAVAMLREEQAVSESATFLDLGTGSGILALACAKLGMTGTALDIDPIAVDNARENFALNAVENVTVRRGALDILEQGRRFDLILANILSGPLVHMATDLVSHLQQPGGSLVLSGILRDQSPRVEAAYLALGLPTPRKLVQGEWVALIWSS
ncbi:ribosomal protein L11 methyltransferase [Desulfonatronum thiosulfatophilum]|uniref:Ribosomal protein L11 methyltransferase n=1 Tax=Desulfonatronum thiosulfatophilum TaxID=617002 RepID=A0A1G6E1H3_9BACT|nr:50S ribosomal protein L11 methyltransferase [Desulfonatronum thiosulfatophilum]SDB51236.1 ribosomal protein L11 methyltransferase [Desulfonatronum thiosulfatophilum]